MSLTPGSRLGVYEITAQIGEGGMGAVYRATDTSLSRQVAIKVLPDVFAGDAERLARFEREAKTLAALNHPHIAAIYAVEKSGGTLALVMELVEGDDLSQRIRKGAIPLDEALPIAKQIAEALEAAHEQGIIHRDLKPANIKVRPDGTVKVLDFGLAKALDPAAASSPEAMNSPTITSPAMTQAGMILGTAAYMAPEQARGKAVDKRADIWAYGAVLFEMLTGTRPFDGQDIAETLGAVIHKEPVWSRLPVATSASTRTVLERCLQKDPRQRMRDIGDVRLALEGAFETVGRPIAPMATVPVPVVPRAWLAALAVAVLGMVVLSLPAMRHVRETAPIEARLDINTPATDQLTSFALSPDDRQIVFVASGDGVPRLWLRSLARTTAQPLAGTEEALYPFWSANSRSVGFFANGKLKRVDLDGALPRVLADAPLGRGGTWNADGVIVFAPSTTGPLERVAASGGPVIPVTTLDQTGHSSHRWPQFLPDGKGLIFFAANGREAPSGVYLGSLDGGRTKLLLTTESAAVYAAPGYLLVSEAGALRARRLDLSRAEVADSDVVAHPVGQDTTVYKGAVAVSATGVLAYRPIATGGRQLVWVDRKGTRTGTMSVPDDAGLLNPALTLLGERVAVQRTDQGNQNIWVMDRAGLPTRITYDRANHGFPVWSPDGLQLALRSNPMTSWDLFLTSSGGGGAELPILEDKQTKFPLDWSIDGRFLLYRVLDPKTRNDLWVLPLTGKVKQPFAIVRTQADEGSGEIAPNGRWVAYDSNETGRFEVYVQSFPVPGPKVQISTAGGIAPRWRRDGLELFYVAPDGTLMAVPMRPSVKDQGLARSQPGELFRVPIAYGGSIQGGNVRQQYDVTADGQHFLVNVTADDALAPPITIVQNWQGGLSARER